MTPGTVRASRDGRVNWVEICAGSLGCEIAMLGMVRINAQFYSAHGPRDLEAFRCGLQALCTPDDSQ